MVAGNTFAIGVAQTDLEDWIGAARPLKRYWANSAGRGIEGGDDRDWFGYSLDHISTISNVRRSQVLLIYKIYCIIGLYVE